MKRVRNITLKCFAEQAFEFLKREMKKKEFAEYEGKFFSSGNKNSERVLGVFEEAFKAVITPDQSIFVHGNNTAPFSSGMFAFSVALSGQSSKCYNFIQVIGYLDQITNELSVASSFSPPTKGIEKLEQKCGMTFFPTLDWIIRPGSPVTIDSLEGFFPVFEKIIEEKFGNVRDKLLGLNSIVWKDDFLFVLSEDMFSNASLGVRATNLFLITPIGVLQKKNLPSLEEVTNLLDKNAEHPEELLRHFFGLRTKGSVNFGNPSFTRKFARKVMMENEKFEGLDL